MASSSYVPKISLPVDSLKCWYTNACSLEKKLDELRCVIAQSAPDIIFITETWFKPAIVQNEVDLEGYKCFRKDRESVKGGGGVCIYVREFKTWKLKEMSCICKLGESSKCEHKKVEQIWCLLTISDTPYKILLGCMYRPDSDKNNDIEINKIIKKSGCLIKEPRSGIDGMILAGDFNYSDIVWEKSGVPIKGKSQKANDFIDAASELDQHIYFKTYIQSLKCDTLDLVFTDKNHTVTEVMQDTILGTSVRTHIGICWKYGIPFEIERGKFKKSYWISDQLLKKKKLRDDGFKGMFQVYAEVCEKTEEFQKDLNSAIPAKGT